jgi:hypothetical protein
MCEKHTTIYTVIKRNQKNMKECDKRKSDIRSEIHVIYIYFLIILDTLFF